MTMRIGFTERGDAGLDLSWFPKLTETTTYQGAVLITKSITEPFRNAVLNLVENDFPFVIHATVTGWGGTLFEPNVPDYKTQLNKIKELTSHVLNPKNLVLRIDPIFPTEEGLKRVGEVLKYAQYLGLLPCRVRISIYDEYPHVRERLKAIGKEPLYRGKFYAPRQLMENAAYKLSEYATRYNLVFETCAEKELAELMPEGTCIETGCLSLKDIEIMRLDLEEAKRSGTNGQNRYGCKCLTLKYELLVSRKQCPHKCIYCYWKDPVLQNPLENNSGVNLGVTK